LNLTVFKPDTNGQLQAGPPAKRGGIYLSNKDFFPPMRENDKFAKN
jgi:hypothetical protein